ncbi:atypical/RIO/RIO2 protein kinase [Saprolegnia parasitica CBS 223.65]|uniref:Serine/threonine-protein kinase RIO2 n=1 Tax=Saprolegnia parasitica (strain CBS 223.65) TaxID=695850 RepID=A0A067BQE0_SAPPC|nr:atypical/RIO/RIO2 protein kinase [Saprolegnia parasitica CBS 223.65]KDO19000.1 atypical/RIO/RIO2 protein kinase [Saprolegnia parasitica CBS 223.65]|eukprot:XP_012210287.1 atypical/RIO/RIO2 protein kinase [Saprolegnia parasitica CBS 223.65]
MKLDVTGMRYLTKDHFKVLTAVELGMKNHEIVPVELISSIAKLRHGGVNKILSHLLRNKLIAHDGTTYDGFKLTYMGYDFLALRVFMKHGHISGLGRQIGVGKESDIYMAVQPDGTEVAIKFHRLGRTSFRAVKNKRDYLKTKKQVNWFYLSKLSAMKENAFLRALYERGFPTPTPIDANRHAIVMSLVDGFPLNQVRRMANSKDAYDNCMDIVVRLAECGLVHCDFNEFNIMMNDAGKITMIDFPQMISTSHYNAEELFNRDVQGLVKFFSRLQHGSYVPDEVPKLQDIVRDAEMNLDIEMEASGFTKQMVKDMETIHELTVSKDTIHEESLENEDVDEEAVDEDDELDEALARELEAKIQALKGDAARDSGDDAASDQDASSDEDEDDNGKWATPVVSEDVRLKVKKAIAKQAAKGGKRTRNSSKLSIKGKLVHKEMF